MGVGVADVGHLTASSPLALDVSPKRALVSLAFLGALLARRHRGSPDESDRHPTRRDEGRVS